MVAPNPDRPATTALPAQRELQRHVREILGSVASSVRQSAADQPVPVVKIVVAAGRPFRVTVEVIDCDAAFGGVLPVVTIQEVTSRKTLSQWVRDHFGLTARESRVAYLLARRRSNAEIAHALHISPHTARRHTENVMHKLNVRSRYDVRTTIKKAIAQAEQPPPDSARTSSRTRSAGEKPETGFSTA